MNRGRYWHLEAGVLLNILQCIGQLPPCYKQSSGPKYQDCIRLVEALAM